MEMHGGNIYKISRQLGIPESEIIDFSSNINPLGVPEVLKKAIIENIDNIKNYPDPHYEKLVSAISSYHDIEPSLVVPGNGATELIYLYCREQKASKALIVAPTFSEYNIALNQNGVEVSYVELKSANNFSFDVNTIVENIQNKYDLLFLCNPNNPTGSLLTGIEVEEIIAAAKENKIAVMLDESFVEFTDQAEKNTAIGIIKKYDNLFILRSMTKIYAIPGLRLGYALCSNQELNEKINCFREPWSINLLADISAQVLLNDIDYLEKTRQFILTERKFLFEGISKIDWLRAYQTNSNFVLVEILNNISAAELRDVLLKRNILIRDASNFMYLNDRFFRIAVKDRSCNERLLSLLYKMSQ